MATIETQPIAAADVWVSLRPDWLILSNSRADNTHFSAGSADVASAHDWFNLVEQKRAQLSRLITQRTSVTEKPLVLLAESDPAAFLAGFWAAILADCNLALANPSMGAAGMAVRGKLAHASANLGE